MKQRIDSSQINELSPEQQDHLREMWEPEYNDVFIYENSGLSKCIDGIYDLLFAKKKKGILPLLSIGQIIEILIQKGIFLSIEQSAEGFFHVADKNINGKGFYYHGLCESLFKALKAVL